MLLPCFSCRFINPLCATEFLSGSPSYSSRLSLLMQSWALDGALLVSEELFSLPWLTEKQPFFPPHKKSSPLILFLRIESLFRAVWKSSSKTPFAAQSTRWRWILGKAAVELVQHLSEAGPCSGFSGNCDLLLTSTICSTGAGQWLLKSLSLKKIFEIWNALDRAVLQSVSYCYCAMTA